jgi:thiol-disulfide isomerase/thioredoxin
MKRITLLTLSTILLSSFAVGAEPPKTETPAAEAAASKPVEEQLKEDPDNVAALNQYMMNNFRQLIPLIGEKPDEAQKRIDSMKQLLDSLQPTQDAAKAMLGQAKNAVNSYEQRIQLMRTTRADLEAKLDTNPDDVQSLSMYGQKVFMELGPLASSETERAEQGLVSAKTFLDGLREKIKGEATKKTLENVDQTLARLQTSIDRAKRLAALVGMDATPLEVEAWVNGTPLTEADLRGKVVLLDFWAVWCGPCIATFPHLREWHEKYADKGLVIIGLTNYYNFTWDDTAGRATRAQGEEKVTPEKEREMLVKFAESHNLHHRFAIQKDKSLAEYYAVSGIPHVVVIDRAGKIRLIRVGSGDKNAKDIGEMLEELIASGG